MLNQTRRNEILALLKREVVPAVGCTEPAAVALCAARCHDELGGAPQKVSVYLSGNMIKNAMSVGIPGTGRTGLPVAIALGALRGGAENGLEVLGGVTPEDVEAADAFIKSGAISISLKKGACDVLYIEVLAQRGDKTVTAVISGQHTRFVYVGNALDPEEGARDFNSNEEGATPQPEAAPLRMSEVWEMATEAPLDEIEFIEEARNLNSHVSVAGLNNCLGHSVGRTLGSASGNMLGDTVFRQMISRTAAACDARMGGAPLAVMSNSGSGNQGIVATMPVVVFAEENEVAREKSLRALLLSHLTVVYIKQSLGRLSALCGCMVAATGTACGLAYMMGADYTTVTHTIKNMIANLTGMICDGAKPGCAMKVASGVSTAIMSALLAMGGSTVDSTEGIIDDDIDKSVANLGRIGREGMVNTDKLILNIMTCKG